MRIIYHPLINLSIICQIQVAQNDIIQALEKRRKSKKEDGSEEHTHTHTPIHTKNDAMHRVGE